MNREIVFRGKRLDNDDWGYGNFYQYSENHTGIYCHRLQKTLRVDPDTVGQFTGLYDKNSAKIWEGDIVEMQLPKCQPVRALVGFKEGSFGLYLRHGFTPFASICNAEFEVVGDSFTSSEIQRYLECSKAVNDGLQSGLDNPNPEVVARIKDAVEIAVQAQAMWDFDNGGAK